MIYKYPSLVEISWYDTTGHHQWFDEEGWSDKEPMIVRSIGYLVQKNKIMVQLTTSIRDDFVIGDLLIIPRGAVKNIRILSKWEEISVA